jgi:hypothetical protein
VIFAAAAAFVVAFFSFVVVVVVAVAVAVAAAAVVAVVAKVHAVAFAGSSFLLVGVVVVGGKAAHRPFFEEFDLLAVHPIRTWFRQLYSMDLTFVVLRRTMLRYYSLFIIYNLNNILFLYYFRIFILIISWHIYSIHFT